MDVKKGDILTTFLAKLSGFLDGNARCVLGGDFNAPYGGSKRRTLDNWCGVNGLTLANPGVLTHFAERGIEPRPRPGALP